MISLSPKFGNSVFAEIRVFAEKYPFYDDYLGFEDELGDDDWVVLGYASRLGEVSLEVRMRMGHTHRSPAQHVGRPDKARVPHLLAESLRRL